jgi:exodeoxyribonuclease-3
MSSPKRLISWNVNGIRAGVKKGFAERLKEINPDVIGLQETKAQDDQVQEALAEIEGYYIYSNSAERKGYSGTAILSKTEPISVTSDIGVAEHDTEGRVLVAEFEDYYYITVYVPNSGRGLIRLDYRKTWDEAFRNYIKGLEKKKPVIVCGDLNVAHQAIDLARPKSNYNKTSGYTQVEIDGMTAHLGAGFTDTFRHFHPDEPDHYSWWSARGGAREKNVGWRLDYFMVSNGILGNVKKAFIMSDVYGSDHCPVGAEVSF